jgi:hypothetical protein
MKMFISMNGNEKQPEDSSPASCRQSCEHVALDDVAMTLTEKGSNPLDCCDQYFQMVMSESRTTSVFAMLGYQTG